MSWSRNLPIDTLRAMGLDYESLKAIKPDIILAMSSTFGEVGPYAERVGFDGIAQAMCGNMHLSAGRASRSRAGCHGPFLARPC